MPILAMDQFGRMYETDPNRGDGLGYKCHGTPVSEGDVTLGSAYLKAKHAYSADVIRNRRQQMGEDQREKAMIMQQRKMIAEKRRQEMGREAFLNNPIVKQNLLRRALGQCSCPDYIDMVSGNVMTANGQTGQAGMTQNEKVMAGLAAPPGPSQAELEQHFMREQANNYLRSRSRGNVR